MRIALSCTGEGFGHASRLAAIGAKLQSKHDVFLFAPLRVHGFLREHGVTARIYPIPYFSLSKKNERIKYAETVVSNLPRLIRLPYSVGRISGKLRRLEIDAAICDYDPYVAWAAWRDGIPVMALNHPGIVLTHPAARFDAFSAMVISTFLMGRYDRRVFCSFFDGDVGPIIRPEIAAATPDRLDHFVVYLKPSYRDMVLRKFRELNVHNVQVFPDSNRDFITALATCKGVIAAAGHQFISEALYLRKPVYVIPQTGQYEQTLNAKMLEASGWGVCGSMRDIATTLPSFLQSVDSFPKKPKPGIRFIFENQLGEAVAIIERFAEAHRPRSHAERVRRFERFREFHRPHLFREREQHSV